MKRIYLFLCITLLPVYAFPQQNSQGWTVPDQSKASKIIYVSSSEGDDATAVVYTSASTEVGSDPQLPAKPVKAFKTITAAEAKVFNGDAAWVLLKTGDTFFEEIHPQSGKSLTEPMLYSYYGTENQLPLLKVGTGHAIKKCCRDFSHFWAIGLSFYAHTRNPDGPDYSSSAGKAGISIFAGEGYTAENILIEGCVFRFFKNNVIQGYGSLSNIRIRRNVILDNYSEEAHAQGLYTSGISDLLLEENIFDHNGWYKQSVNSDNNKLEGQATIFNHNTYFVNSKSTQFIGNAFFRPSSIGTKWTAQSGEASASDIVITNNLYYDCEVGISIGGNDDVPPYRFKNITLTDNVLSAAGQSQQTNRTLGWNIEINDWDGGTCSNNYIIHQTNSLITNGIGIRIMGETRNVELNNNLFYNLKYTGGFIIDTVHTKSNVTISENHLNLTLPSSRYFVRTDVAASSIFSNNNYNGVGADDDFRVGKTSMSYSSWLELSGETGSTTIAPAYPEPERSVELYASNILGLTDMDAFYTELRKMSRLTWKEEYTAPVINAWIKEGFNLSGMTSDTIQAEDYTSASGGSIATHTSGYTGTGFYDYAGQNSYAEWTFTSAEAGFRTITFRYGNGSTVDRSCDLSVNGSPVEPVPFSVTGEWINWTDVTVTVYAEAGENTIRLTANTTAGGPNLDCLILGSDDTPPVVTGQTNVNHPLPTEAAVVYPNPSTGLVTVKGHGELTIRNSLGQVIHSGIVEGALELDLSAQSTGMFTVTIKQENSIMVEKLIIN